MTAAADGQLGLEAGPWPDDVRLRVRMGLHTGHPEPFEDNLVGLDVHLAARISATAHGGQVVLSSTTARAGHPGRYRPARHSSTSGCTASRTSPNRSGSASWSCPGCRSPSPRCAASAPRAACPPPRTRSSAATTSWRLSPHCCRPGRQRLVTLTGPGGTGKTRLSLAVAEELAPAFPDGVHFVDLATATEHSMAWTTLADTLGRSGEQQAALLDHLRDRRVLVVLDNLEQLPDSGAPVVSALLGATRRVHVLATSRRPLRVPGEQAYPVPPLGLPDPHARHPDAWRSPRERSRCGCSCNRHASRTPGSP